MLLFGQTLKNHELRSKKSRIARNGIHKLNHELAKQRIARTTNCEEYLYFHICNTYSQKMNVHLMKTNGGYFWNIFVSYKE